MVLWTNRIREFSSLEFYRPLQWRQSQPFLNFPCFLTTMSAWHLHNFAFEDNFDVDSWVTWIDKNWIQFTIPIVILYILAVYLGRKLMSQREGFQLQTPLLIWNILLAAFSIIGSSRDAPVMISIVQHDGWHASICDSKYYQAKYRVIWVFIFVLSKIPELIDTFFIILRKRKLIFLHWYHHSAVVIFGFYMVSGRVAMSRWFVFMNFLVHSIMYTYYALRAANFKPPTFISMAITTLQILQMIMGTYFVSYALITRLSGGVCDISYDRLAYAMFMYTTFGVLFTYFFYASYIKHRPRKDMTKEP